MLKLFTLAVVAFLVSCSPRPASLGETVALSPETPASDPAVSAKNSDVAEQNSATLNTTSIVADSSLYIGEIRIFPETGELYTPVYYHDHLDTEGLYQSLTKKTDSVVYEDTERQRYRVPTEVASNYFNLAGLDSISVYKNGQLAGKARFIRVEHLSDVIEGQFVAVFKPVESSSLPDQLDYCVSSAQNPYKTIDVTYEEIENEQLTKSLLEAFVPDSSRVWNVLHMRIMPYHSVYSAISMQSRLLLVETNEGQSRILKDLKEDWFVSDITPLHLERNGKPFLLLSMGVNETDMMWTALTIFSGEQYVFSQRNRVKDF